MMFERTCKSRGVSVLSLVLVLGLVPGCKKDKLVEDRRSSCEVCHMPRSEPGAEPMGIEAAHPFGDVNLACTDCHGGNSDAYVQADAHVDPRGSPKFIRNLTSSQLDRVDPSYLQFINPGDLRVANTGCGGGSPAANGSGCHQDIVDRVRRSMMAHTSGEVVVARYRAGAQDDALARVGATALFDDDFDNTIPNTIESMDRFDPPPPQVTQLSAITSTGSATTALGLELYAQIQDDYMAKSCFRCHLWDFGENRFRADFRSSGCSSCHMLYGDDGLSQSADPTIAKDVTPHPLQHQLTSKIPTEQCAHCHYRGGRIGPAYQGYREAGGPGFNPPNIETLEVGQHGHDPAFYIVDEDTTNSTDETPPDIHFEKGLHCVDCHRERDSHGDGHLYSDTQVFVLVECEDCHGTIEEESTLTFSNGTPIEGLERDDDGNVWLTGRVDEVRHPVTQIKRSVDPSSPEYNVLADRSMGRDDSGFSHNDRIECYTCHAAWYPSCYGCHVTVDYSRSSRLLTTGETRVGKPSGEREWVAVDDLVLMWNTDGKIAPSMPAERFTLTVDDANGNRAFERRVRLRSATSSSAAFGQRTFQPHTIRKRSRFSLCQRCHILADGSNRDLVRVTVGLGSDRYLLEDDRGVVHRLDAIVSEDGQDLVEVGHDEPHVSRPLEAELRDKLLNEPVMP